MNSCAPSSPIKSLYRSILLLQRKKLVSSYYFKNEGTEAQADVIVSVTELVQGDRTNRIQSNVCLFSVHFHAKLILHISSLRGRMV